MGQALEFAKVTIGAGAVIAGEFLSFCQSCWPTVKSYAVFVGANVVQLFDYVKGLVA